MLYNGEIYLIFGPMFSGKSTELDRLLGRYQVAGNKCLLLRSDKDLKRCYDNNNILTHDGKESKVKQQFIDKLDINCDIYNKYDVIGIDEGQFFHDIVNFSETMACRGKIIIIAALDGTFERNNFGGVSQLICKAEHITKLTAICFGCKKEASFSRRITNDKTIELVGGIELYKPVCRKCYYDKNLILRADDGDKEKVVVVAYGGTDDNKEPVTVVAYGGVDDDNKETITVVAYGGTDDNKEKTVTVLAYGGTDY